MLPIPSIRSRMIDLERECALKATGLDPLIVRILSARTSLSDVSPIDFLEPKLSNLDSPHRLADLPVAVERLIQAIEAREVIGLETDHDCDGQTSQAILYFTLVEIFKYPKSLVQTYIGHRLEEGYGLSEGLCERILSSEPRPRLIITADNGSTDEMQIARLKSEGIDVIVTDHHEIPSSGIPMSAVAVLNPTRTDCQYPDPLIAGCMVAWLLMAATRTALIQKGFLSKEASSMATLLDFVAIGTIADCVSLARSLNNRAVVRYGLKLIQKSMRPCWQAIRAQVGEEIGAEDIGFRVAPLLNADGRLDDALGSVSFLLSDTIEVASNWINHLTQQNDLRKKIQDRMTQQAIPLAQAQYLENRLSICLMLQDGHPGVHGISASRIKDMFGRPTIIFSPKFQSEEMITGSARGIDGDFHLRGALQLVSDLHPGLILKFGGHKGAAGLTILKKDFERFSRAFEEAVFQQLTPASVGPVVLTDGTLPVEYFSLDHLKKLQVLEPFGREFEPPVFEWIGQVLAVTLLGQEAIHAKVRLKVEHTLVEAIWFRCRLSESDPIPIEIGEWVKIAFIPKINYFRGNVKFNPQIVAMEKLDANLS